jgi:hypothetical protein
MYRPTNPVKRNDAAAHDPVLQRVCFCKLQVDWQR